MRRELLRLEGVSYGQAGHATLSGFCMELRAGEVLGIYSTHKAIGNDIVGLIAGRIGADCGRIYLDNEPSPFDEADAHRQRKVGVIHSARTLIDVLSVAENIFVIRSGFKAGLIDMALLKRQTRQLIDEFGLTLAPDTLARKLSAHERCQLEVLKAIALGAQLVVLHDLSSFLSDFEIARLFDLVQRLTARGIGFVLVDHSPQSLATYADRVIVVKHGRNYWTFARGELSDEALALCYSRHRAGAARAADTDNADNATASAPADAPAALSFAGVSSGVLDDVSFALAAGDELCIVDPQGQAIDEIRRLLNGDHPPTGGRISVGGRPYTARNGWEALDQRVAFVAEDPAQTMIFRDLPAIDNLCLPASRKARGFWLNPAYRASCEREYAVHFAPGTLRKYPDALSAQDRHKLVYCRWHLFCPAVVVCIRPYSSVDKTLEAISAQFIGELRRKGIAVLILTSNAAEAELAGQKITLDQKKPPPHPKIAL